MKMWMTIFANSAELVCPVIAAVESSLQNSNVILCIRIKRWKMLLGPSTIL